MKIELKRGAEIKHVPTGFSITTFFFGAFVPLLRLDKKFLFLFIN